MNQVISIDRRSAILVAIAAAAGGAALGVGAFLGGYALGERAAPEPTAAAVPTELAEKTYTVADLEAALGACGIEGVAVEDGVVSLAGEDHPGYTRQCFVAEMGASEVAQAEYRHINLGEEKDDWLTSGEYTWSNVHMEWEQTRAGRDLTITVTL